MFRRFVRSHCKNLKTPCTFLIMLQSSKSAVACNWCRQIWDVRGNTFFTCWKSAGWSWKSFFSLFHLEIHFWGVSEAKNAVQAIHTQRGGGIPFWIFSDQFDRIPIAGWPSACKKRITTHISNFEAPATGNSTLTRLKHDEKLVVEKISKDIDISH